MSIFRGSGVALVTPFKKDGSVNYDKYKELIEYHIENNTDAIITVGTTGEASTLTDEEHREVIRFTVKVVNKRIPVIAGTGSNDTSYSIELSKYSEEVGVDGLLIVTPYYNKTTQKGLINHFTAIADSVNIPIILYNVPSRTGMNISIDTVVELSKHKNIQAIKEASGDISYVTEIARLCDDNFDIYSGNDDIIVPIMSIGGSGVISVVANILPNETHNLVHEYLDGNTVKAREIQLKLNGLINSLFIETNPIPVKTAMNLLDMEVGELRAPLYEMQEENVEILVNQMRKLKMEV
ncbi:4-hydroxy-tetrahydrodipicolinate synthase [Clostridiaceae bacterium M8S5]|nr:4-hydroxy-tetrahydrodipicolinate synthase [Clostridiaceae bacterium M8S5]